MKSSSLINVDYFSTNTGSSTCWLGKDSVADVAFDEGGDIRKHGLLVAAIEAFNPKKLASWPRN